MVAGLQREPVVVEFCYCFSFGFVESMIRYTKDLPLDLIGYACIPVKLFA